ncbi:hypothetical protein [Blochmannia endosymbiont of Camponotus (Colobopsis) obliquus]|nr:hypothetical protein [Blochmannia endosymbiont of Camponotus (Colobopsis) obliquus]
MLFSLKPRRLSLGIRLFIISSITRLVLVLVILFFLWFIILWYSTLL